MASTERTRTFKQPRAERTYSAILKAAAKVFPRLGFDGTQTPDIAREAKISTGAVYRYFDDKRQIFLAMLELELAKIRVEMDGRLRNVVASAGADPATAIEQLVDTLFLQIERDARLVRVFGSLALTDPDVAALKAKADDEDRAALALMIEGLISKDVVKDARATATVVHIAAVATATEVALRPKKNAGPSADAMRAALSELLVTFFFGAPAASARRNR